MPKSRRAGPPEFLRNPVRAIVIAFLIGLGLATYGLASIWAPDLPVETLKPRWAPPPSTFVSLPGLSVHVRDEGRRDDPEPILLLHGTSASLHTWDGWTDRLKPTRRVIRFDLPGFGLTGPAAGNDYTMPAYVGVVIGMMDRLGIARATIAGNSFGGQVAWETALAHPSRIARLVLIDASGYALNSTSVPLGFRLARAPGLNRAFEYILPRSVIASSVRNVYGDPSKVDDALIERYYDLTRRAGNRQALALRMQQSPGASPRAEQIKTLALPTLILWGGKDGLVSPDNAERFRRDIAGSRLVLFDDLGHVPHEEDPARTVAALIDFLSR